jgi:hypothetical protein
LIDDLEQPVHSAKQTADVLPLGQESTEGNLGNGLDLLAKRGE